MPCRGRTICASLSTRQRFCAIACAYLRAGLAALERAAGGLAHRADDLVGDLLDPVIRPAAAGLVEVLADLAAAGLGLRADALDFGDGMNITVLGGTYGGNAVACAAALAVLVLLLIVQIYWFVGTKDYEKKPTILGTNGGPGSSSRAMRGSP